MLELRSSALPLKDENKDTKPRHGLGGNSTYSTKPKCGAKTRAGGGHPCRRMAGHGTSHLGSGRCKYHGGSSPIRHGLYSKVMPKKYESYQESLDDKNYKDMREHVAVIDGFVLPAAISRGTARPGTPGVPDPLETQMMAIDIKSKDLKRMADIEDRGKIKMTEKEMSTFVLEIVTVVSEYVDAATLRKIAERFGVKAMTARLVNGYPPHDQRLRKVTHCLSRGSPSAPAVERVLSGLQSGTKRPDAFEHVSPETLRRSAKKWP